MQTELELEEDRRRSNSSLAMHGFSRRSQPRSFGRYHSFDCSSEQGHTPATPRQSAPHNTATHTAARHRQGSPDSCVARGATYIARGDCNLSRGANREQEHHYDRSRYNRSNSAQELRELTPLQVYTSARKGMGMNRVPGDDEDMAMATILKELENTGFFKQTLPDVRGGGGAAVAAGPIAGQTDDGKVDYKKLAMVSDDLLKIWESSQTENSRLHMELSEAKKDLESTRQHVQSIAKQVAKDEAVTHKMKKEKEIVVRKMTEMEEELKLLAVSGNLTDKTLEQLKTDNDRLRSENTALLRVIASMS